MSGHDSASTRTRELPALDRPAPEAERYINRELSWLEFNRRVLALATDSTVPLLERVRMLAIFHRNLDEFFMVRVAGLHQQVAAGVTARGADGLSPTEQLSAISARLRPLLATAEECLHDQLLPLLAREGIELSTMQQLPEREQLALDRYFEDEVFPVLTPLAVDPGHPFPYISNLSLSLAVTVQDRKTGDRRFARVKVPEVLPRFVPLDGTDVLVPLDELITARLGRLFPGMEVVESYPFRVTRDADLEFAEDEAEDLLLEIEKELRRRRFRAVVRLEVDDRMPGWLLALLQEELGIEEEATYPVGGLLGCADLEQLSRLDRPDLLWEPWQPVPHPRLRPEDDGKPRDVFAEVRRGDILLHHPYDSFTHSVERFVTEAARDPQVLAIKQTLYRTSGDSPIVHALIRAAESGKQVVALVELKARFDEEANILWARALERAGVHVVYGLVGLKTHSKTSLVVRREPDGIRRYVHIGTGNYNPRTALEYTDLGLLSADSALGADLTDMFNFLTGYARHDTYRKLLVAPVSLRERIVRLIRSEVEAAEQSDRQGLIRLKLNALIDPALIHELYCASQAGVRIELLIRGICGLRPGIPGTSDRIRVMSIVGRFLEHARIMQFGPDNLWIGSADWMPRNLDRRVEAMVPVADPSLREQLRWTLDVQFADNRNSWHLEADGSWRKRVAEDGEPVRDCHVEFMAAAAGRGPEQSSRGSSPVR